MDKQRIAICTGISGQDGSYLAELLLEKGYKVVGLIRRGSMEDKKLYNIEHLLNNPNLIIENGDLTDAPSLWRVIGTYRPDEFYNLAAQSHVGASFTSPESTLGINATGVLNCLEAIRTLKPDTKFYQASTSEMFGDNIDAPQNENTPFSPVSPYACSKVYAHNLLVNYRKAYGLFACSGILFNHESPRRGEQFVTRKITKAAARIKLGLQNELRLGNLDAKRDWGYAKEYVEGMWMMLQHHTPDDYVLGTGKTYTIHEFINCISEIAGYNLMSHVVIDDKYKRPSEVPLLLADSAKAKKVLGWEPKTDLKQLAELMYNSDLEKEKQISKRSLARRCKKN
jgi:GDPmannose 4,6-dehydratase